MNRIIHVKLTSDDPERLTEFYNRAFSWNVSKFPDPPDGWRMDSGSGQGVNSSIYRSEDSPLDRHMSIAISVNSIEDVAEDLVSAGGIIMHEMIEAFGNRYLYCQDPDGNVICLVEFS